MSETKITSFKNEFFFLSNFSPSVIFVNGKKYNTVEHAYQAAKTDDEALKEAIRLCPTPGKAKKLGRTVPIRSDWEDIKLDVMRKLIRQKFENPFLRPLLLVTEDAELIEVNYWHDTCWGMYRGEGQNWLGRMLMEERARIKLEEPDSY